MLAAKVTASKKSASVSVTMSCLRFMLPPLAAVFTRCRTWIVCGGSPMVGLVTTPGTISFCNAALLLGLPTCTAGEQVVLDGAPMPIPTQLVNVEPTGVVSRATALNDIR